jgi:hypothetical protein
MSNDAQPATSDRPQYITLDVNRNGHWSDSYVRKMFPQSDCFQTYNVGRGLLLCYLREQSHEAAREAWAFSKAEHYLFRSECAQPYRAAPTPEQEDTLAKVATRLWPLFRDRYLSLDLNRCSLVGFDRAPHYGHPSFAASRGTRAQPS